MYRLQVTQEDVLVPVHASWNQSLSHKVAELFDVGFPEKNCPIHLGESYP